MAVTASQDRDETPRTHLGLPIRRNHLATALPAG
jgi:hypothetical protein